MVAITDTSYSLKVNAITIGKILISNLVLGILACIGTYYLLGWGADSSLYLGTGSFLGGSTITYLIHLIKKKIKSNIQLQPSGASGESLGTNASAPAVPAPAIPVSVTPVPAGPAVPAPATTALATPVPAVPVPVALASAVLAPAVSAPVIPALVPPVPIVITDTASSSSSSSMSSSATTRVRTYTFEVPVTINCSRNVFKVTQDDGRVYYIKIIPKSTGLSKPLMVKHGHKFPRSHQAGRQHPLNEALACKIGEFMGTSCIASTYYFHNMDEWEHDPINFRDLRNHLKTCPQFTSSLDDQAIIIQEGIAYDHPDFGPDGYSMDHIEKRNRYFVECPLNSYSAHEAFLMIILTGNWDAKLENCVVDRSNCVKLIDNDVVGSRTHTLSSLSTALWLAWNTSASLPFNSALKEKLLNIRREGFVRYLNNLKDQYAARMITMDENFITNILYNFDKMIKVLNISETPLQFIEKWNLCSDPV